MQGLEKRADTGVKKVSEDDENNSCNPKSSQGNYFSSRKDERICWSLAGPFMVLGAPLIYIGIKTEEPGMAVAGGVCEAISLVVIWAGGYSPFKIAAGVVEGVGEVTRSITYNLPKRLYRMNKARKLIKYRRMRRNVESRVIS